MVKNQLLLFVHRLLETGSFQDKKQIVCLGLMLLARSLADVVVDLTVEQNSCDEAKYVDESKTCLLENKNLHS